MNEKNKENYKGRDLRVDNVRGWLIFLVVLGHFLLPVERTRPIHNLLYMIYTFHMPCFILISGYMAKGVYDEKRGFRWDRWAVLLWFYIIYKFLVNITENLGAESVRMLPDFLHEAGAPWYLIALMIYYLLIPVMKKLKPVSVFTILALFIGASFSGYIRGIGDFLALDRVFAFMPYFFWGYYMETGSVRKFLDSPFRVVIQGVSLFLTLAIAVYAYDVFKPVTLIVYGAAYGRYPALIQPYCWEIALCWHLIASIMSMGLIALVSEREMPVFTRLGQRTLQIYILHRPIRDVLQYIGYAAWIHAEIPTTIVGLIGFSFMLTEFLSMDVFYSLFHGLKKVPELFFPKPKQQRRGRSRKRS